MATASTPLRRFRRLPRPKRIPTKLTEVRPGSVPMLLGLGVAALVAVIDGALDPNFTLIGLFAVPPLITAAQATRAETGIVAAVSFALAVLAGVWEDMLFEPNHLSLIAAVAAAGLAGVWIAGLRPALQREIEAADLLAEAGTLLEDTLDPEAAVQHVAALAVPALADAATVELLEEDGTIHRAVTVAPDPKIRGALEEAARGGPLHVDGEHPISRAVRTARTQSISEISDEDWQRMARAGRDLESLRRTRIRTALFVPLRAYGRTLGVLALGRYEAGPDYDGRTVRLAEALARRAALAIENATLHSGQTFIADTLQRGLLPPSIPEVPGVEIGTQFYAAGDLNEVGGDFYDLFDAGSGDWMAVVGDVCGKGAEAAAITAQARHTIRAAASHVMRPSLILTQLSEAMLAQRSDLRFCTAALVRIAPTGDAADLTISAGGHPPPLVLRRTGEVEALGSPDLLIGAVPDNGVRRTDHSGRLERGDCLVLFTDGLVESSDRTKVDHRRAKRMLSDCAGLEAPAIAERLVATALEQQDDHPRDDIAVLVLRFTGE